MRPLRLLRHPFSVLLTRRAWKLQRKSPLMVTISVLLELVAGEGLGSHQASLPQHVEDRL